MGNGKPSLAAGTDELGKLQADLQELPRHQWDNYLWDFCRRFVQRHARPDSATEGLVNHADSRAAGR